VRGDDARDRDRRADGHVDRAALQPYGFAADQVGADRRERDGQVLDQEVAEDLADGVEDLLRPQHARGGQ
jgi:hypothetical protein